jgi:hypothetical protein
MLTASMIESLSSSETSVNFYVTKQRSIPEECFHTRRHENLNSQKDMLCPYFAFKYLAL